MRILLFGSIATVAASVVTGAPKLDLPGERRAIELDSSADPFVDQNFSAPTPSLANTRISEDEVRSRTFTASVKGLTVTSVVLTNDPAYRAVSINKYPVKIGSRLPPDLFPVAPSGEVTVGSIEPGRIVLLLKDGKDKENKDKFTSCDLNYNFTPVRKAAKKQ